MSIKRYSIASTGPSDGCEASSFDGTNYVAFRADECDWVRYDDHVAEVERLRLDLATAEDKLAHATQAVAELRRRVPNPDDLRLVLSDAVDLRDPAVVAMWWAAYDRVRATLEEA